MNDTTNEPANEATKTGEADATASGQPAFKTWQCILCGFVYKEAEGMPQDGIPAGTRWEDVPEDWVCPDCSTSKLDFEMIEA